MKKTNNNLIIVIAIFASMTLCLLIELVTATNSYTINGAVVEETLAASLVEPYQGGEFSSPFSPSDIVEEETAEDTIRRIAKEQNFEWADYLVRLAKCESTLNPQATNKNRNGSIDRGLFQWNDKLPPLGGITDECAYSVECSTLATINAINLGYQTRWMCNKIIK